MITTASILLKKVTGVYRWEKIRHCPLCGKKSFSGYASYRNGLLNIRLQKCDHCGLIVQNPRLSSASLTEYYADEYRQCLKKKEDDKHIKNMFDRGTRRGAYIAAYLEKNFIDYKGKSMFEFGCGYGGILEHFRRKDCQVSGCDIDEGAIQCGRKRGLDLWATDTSMSGDFNSKVDIVMLSHVVEHIAEPIPFLQKIRTILKPQGYLYIEVPGVNNPRKDMMRNVQLGHLMYFNLETSRLLFEEAGFHFICGNEVVQSCFR